jgi:hypothetical protein
MLGIIFVKPKWGTFLIWPILFTYPHGWWYYRQFLPLNIGVDDLFCIALFLAVLIQRNLLKGVRIRFSYAFWIISAFTVIATVANIAGSRDAPPFERILYVKAIMKFGVYWGLFYAVLHCIDDIHDLKMQFTMFSLGAVAGASIVIMQYFFPYQMEIFAAPIALEKVGFGFGTRGSGAFMNPNTAACVLCCSLMLVIAAMRLQKTIISRMVVYAFIFVLLTAMIVTRSRSGLMALGGTLVLMAFLGRGKKVAWLVITAIVVIGMAFAGARLLYTERIEDIYDPTTGVWGANVEGRIKTWSSYLETAMAKDYLLGQGVIQGVEKNGGESHNAYVSLLTVYGIGGALWGLIAVIIFFRRTFALRHFPDPLISTIGAGCIWALIAWGIYAMTADAISSQYPRYLLFYLVVLLDRGYNIAREQQEWLLYEEQATQPVLYPEWAEIY